MPMITPPLHQRNHQCKPCCPAHHACLHWCAAAAMRTTMTLRAVVSWLAVHHRQQGASLRRCPMQPTSQPRCASTAMHGALAVKSSFTSSGGLEARCAVCCSDRHCLPCSIQKLQQLTPGMPGQCIHRIHGQQLPGWRSYGRLPAPAYRQAEVTDRGLTLSCPGAQAVTGAASAMSDTVKAATGAASSGAGELLLLLLLLPQRAMCQFN